MSPIMFAVICRNMLGITGSINIKPLIQQCFYIIDDSRTYSEDNFSAYLIDLQPWTSVKEHVPIIKIIKNPILVYEYIYEVVCNPRLCIWISL